MVVFRNFEGNSFDNLNFDWKIVSLSEYPIDHELDLDLVVYKELFTFTKTTMELSSKFVLCVGIVSGDKKPWFSRDIQW